MKDILMVILLIFETSFENQSIQNDNVAIPVLFNINKKNEFKNNSDKDACFTIFHICFFFFIKDWRRWSLEWLHARQYLIFMRKTTAPAFGCSQVWNLWFVKQYINKPGCLHTHIYTRLQRIMANGNVIKKGKKKGENIPMVINSNRGDSGVGLQYSRIRS